MVEVSSNQCLIEKKILPITNESRLDHSSIAWSSSLVPFKMKEKKQNSTFKQNFQWCQISDCKFHCLILEFELMFEDKNIANTLRLRLTGLKNVLFS